MVFSFFRKKEPPTEPPPAKRKVAKPPPNPETLQPMSAKIPPRPAATPVRKPPAPAPKKAPEKTPPKPFSDSATGGLEVSDSAAELSGAAEEAAILYANNQIQPAIAVLLQGIGEKSGATNRSLWLMLFDLYQLQGMQQEFDDLALDFVVKFERSPPPWRDQQKVKSAAPKAVKPVTAGSINLSGKLTAACKPQLDQLARGAETKTSTRLDLSKITGLTTEGANTLLEALQRLRRAKAALSLSGVDSLAEVAAQAMTPAKGAEKKAYCQLLLELYQVLGNQAEFDDLAVQYAVETEVSPPSWEAVPNWRAQSGEATSEAEEPVTEAAPVDKFALAGEMTGSTDPQLRDLVDYAASRLSLEVDLANLRRLDFVCCGMLLNILTGIKQGGKSVRLSGANEMVFALCRVMGVDQVATLVKSKHH